jgi:hypothetical protein
MSNEVTTHRLLQLLITHYLLLFTIAFTGLFAPPHYITSSGAWPRIQ